MDREIVTGTATLAIEARLDSIRVRDNLYAFALTRRRVSAHASGGFRPYVPLRETGIEEEQGFVNGAGLAAIRRGEPAPCLPLAVATEECLARILSVGTPAALVGPDGLPGLERALVHDAILADPSATDRILRLDIADYIPRGTDGLPLRSAIAFAPGLGHRPIDESRYDLDAVADLLDARDDVAVYGLGDWDVDWLSTASAARDGIHLSEPDALRAIAFRWTPSAREHEAVWEAAYAAAGTSDPSQASLQLQRVALEEDFLGLASCLRDAPGPRP